MADGTIPLKCSCGEVRGKLLDAHPRRINHIVCYCKDCQAFANFTGAGNVLDSVGGTEIIQASSNKVEITEGRENLACMRLTDKGMIRWYANCCRTPLGNTMPKNKMPFVGIIHSFVEVNRTNGVLRHEQIGPIVARLNGREKLSRGEIFGVIYRLLKIIFFPRFTGGHKISPFFDRDGNPVSEPEVAKMGSVP